MKCHLCGLEKKLIEAHVIPRSFHRIDPQGDGPPRLVTNAKGRYTQKIPKGIYDSSVVCLECERTFSTWDDYGYELFFTKWDKFEPLHHNGKQVGYKLPSYDYPKLKLFVLSVLWRASASSHPMYSMVDLGPREVALRSSIQTADPGDEDHFGVLLQAFDENNIGILNPHSERFSGLRFIRLYLAHVIAFIKVDSRPLDPTFKHLALTPNAPLMMANKEFRFSPERRIMQTLVMKDIARNSIHKS